MSEEVKRLIEARKIRETADYNIQKEVIEPVALLKIEEGKAFLTAIKNLLGVL